MKKTSKGIIDFIQDGKNVFPDTTQANPITVEEVKKALYNIFSTIKSGPKPIRIQLFGNQAEFIHKKSGDRRFKQLIESASEIITDQQGADYIESFWENHVKGGLEND